MREADISGSMTDPSREGETSTVNLWEGKAVAKDRWEGEYMILKGTGKYKGIKGKGTWSLESVAPMQWYTDEEWEVELP